MSNKAPYYPWYPKDAETDETYRLMNCEELGAYERLRDHQWLEGSIPNDERQLATIIGHGMTPARLRHIWPDLQRCFPDRGDGRLANERIERQRNERQEFAETMAISGAKGAAKRWQGHKPGHSTGHSTGHSHPTERPLAKNGSASALASALASASTESKEHSPAPPKEPADPRVKEFLDWFQSEYKLRRHGADYLVKWQKDGALVKAMLGATDLPRLKLLAQILLSDKCDEEWIVNTDRGIGILNSKFNWLSDRLAEWEAKRAVKA